ncbi:c-type cytochrome [Aquiflexum sp.]|uniref:c-type cytochrome n=1 Tax=Aquiflexum sp. TaxID=1872584 RepID=UPI0035945D56
MKNKTIIPLGLSLIAVLGLSECQQPAKSELPELKQSEAFNGFQTLEEYGRHLTLVSGCHDCHTPKKMGPNGPELDMEFQLSGHPTAIPLPELDRADLEQKGVAATQTLTAWIGPWGISYAANLTPDEDTGIGFWTEEQFSIALREGRYKGIKTARQLLPPMPWDMYSHMTDQETKAIYAYLKSIKPINNLVPNAVPPTHAMN